MNTDNAMLKSVNDALVGKWFHWRADSAYGSQWTVVDEVKWEGGAFFVYSSELEQGILPLRLDNTQVYNEMDHFIDSVCFIHRTTT